VGLGLWAKIGAAEMLDGFRQAATEAAAIAMLIATVAPFAFLLAVDDISGLIGGLFATLGTGPVPVMLGSIAILYVVGLFLDIGAAILLFGPLLVPLATAAGIDPIAFGVVIVVNLMIGGLTPPFGVLVFVVSGITLVPTGQLFRAVMPYVLALSAALALIAGYALIGAA
jgi:TRAP-type C4-dicarboxylate transport system permease large subunit